MGCSDVEKKWRKMNKPIMTWQLMWQNGQHRLQINADWVDPYLQHCGSGSTQVYGPMILESLNIELRCSFAKEPQLVKASANDQRTKTSKKIMCALTCILIQTARLGGLMVRLSPPIVRNYVKGKIVGSSPTSIAFFWSFFGSILNLTMTMGLIRLWFFDNAFKVTQRPTQAFWENAPAWWG